MENAKLNYHSGILHFLTIIINILTLTYTIVGIRSTNDKITFIYPTDVAHFFFISNLAILVDSPENTISNLNRIEYDVYVFLILIFVFVLSELGVGTDIILYIMYIFIFFVR